jgi:hypothetical protein
MGVLGTLKALPVARTRPWSAQLVARLALGVVLCVACPASGSAVARTPAGSEVLRAHVHYACSGANSSKVPCRFSTPSGNIRCLWKPSPNNVACELVASGRGYRLRPTGRARAIKLRLRRRGETLPTGQQLVFPQSMSCRDTNSTMTCNQDFGLGRFRLVPKARAAPADRPPHVTR